MSVLIEQMLKSYEVEFENSNRRILRLLYKLYRLGLVKGKEPVSTILYIWNSGDMVYKNDC